MILSFNMEIDDAESERLEGLARALSTDIIDMLARAMICAVANTEVSQEEDMSRVLHISDLQVRRKPAPAEGWPEPLPNDMSYILKHCGIGYGCVCNPGERGTCGWWDGGQLAQINRVRRHLGLPALEGLNTLAAPAELEPDRSLTASEAVELDAQRARALAVARPLVARLLGTFTEAADWDRTYGHLNVAWTDTGMDARRQIRTDWEEIVQGALAQETQG